MLPVIGIHVSLDRLVSYFVFIRYTFGPYTQKKVQLNILSNYYGVLGSDYLIEIGKS